MSTDEFLKLAINNLLTGFEAFIQYSIVFILMLKFDLRATLRIITENMTKAVTFLQYRIVHAGK